jgi:predicted membrane protein
MKNVKLPSNKSFGVVFFIVFIIIGFWPILNGNDIRIWSILISLIFLILGLFNSRVLTPLNKIWFKFGLLLGNIISPIVMGIIFFGIVTPTGLLMKVFRKDILKLNKNNANTYWENRDNSNNDMRDQF